MKLKLVTRISLLLMNGMAFAVNPVQGFYGGVFLGPSYSPSVTIQFTSPYAALPLTANPTITHSISGNIGGQIGYRYCHFRGELEFVYNNGPYKSLQLGSITLNKASKWNTDLAMKGETNTVALLVNGFYDFYTPGQTVFLSPYAGLGIGYAYVRDSVSFFYNNQMLSGSNLTQNSTVPAGQGILGLGYFLDDYTFFGLDVRYLTTSNTQSGTHMQSASLNLTFNGTFG